MKTIVSLLFVTLIALFLLASPAVAHHLTVTATASCSATGIPVITYTVVSWDLTGIAGSDAEIDVLFNGVKVDMEAFSLAHTPPNQFTNTMPAPSATNTVIVEARVAVPWDDGFPGGQTSSVTVTVPTNCAPGTGRFTGGGKQVVVGVATVTKGFEVDCDLTQPSNNLEVNWRDASGTHQFHMEDFLTAMCTLNGNPAPPKAPVNTIVASGTGRVDGVQGFTVQFTLIDNGEPGTNDQAGFMIFETANPSNVVLSFPVMTITTGNIQAHVDQR